MSANGNPYPNLIFAPGVDWQGVEDQLWSKLNTVGVTLGKQLTVISGYRTPDHSVAVGGFRDDPHTRRIAADVQVVGVPLGLVPGAMAAIAKVGGLISGNQPNFYQGHPDPGHVQLGSGAPAGAAPGGAAAAGTPTGGATGPTVAGSGCLPAALTLFAIGVAIFEHLQ